MGSSTTLLYVEVTVIYHVANFDKLTAFFPPYALLEVPSNIILKMLRPSIWITILLFSWV